jgi:endo-1,4-beta-mannosidase
VAPGSRRSPSRAAVVGVVIALVAGGALVFAARRSRGSAHSTGTDTTVSTTPGGPPASGPIAFTDLGSKMGLSTGAQLWGSSLSEIDSTLSGIAATGAHWVRTSLHWKDVEPASANQDDWVKADRIVADAQQQHLSLIFTVDVAPDWAGGQQTGAFGTDPATYAAFVAKVAARYRGKVDVYELGNEPNLTSYVTHPSAQTYTQILRAAYPAIKAADPGAFVLTGGLGGTRDKSGNIDGETFARQLYQDGAKGFFDAIAYHPYTYPQLPSKEATAGGRGWSHMLGVRALMVQNGDGAKPIWITEFGAPTQGPKSVSEAMQAEILQNGFDLWKTYSWGGVMSWFTYQDKGTDSTTHKDWFGLISQSGAHKPSYAAYAALARPGN